MAIKREPNRSGSADSTVSFSALPNRLGSARTYRRTHSGHSRVTHLATVLKEPEMREFFGWTKDSDMPSIYVHLSGRDVDDTLLDHYGLKRAEREPTDGPLAKRQCRWCEFENPASAKFCDRCARPLDEATTCSSTRNTSGQMS